MDLRTITNYSSNPLQGRQKPFKFMGTLYDLACLIARICEVSFVSPYRPQYFWLGLARRYTSATP